MATKKQTVFLKNDKVLEQMGENIKIARKRRKLTMIQVAKAKRKNEKPKTLYAIDFLLGVYDENRMGALRFKIDPNGDFLDSNKTTSTPPWSSI
jgi:transcriptional regulator with XRE-family HTH domain